MLTFVAGGLEEIITYLVGNNEYGFNGVPHNFHGKKGGLGVD